MFNIGQISPGHTQWTLGEFTYAYIRLHASYMGKHLLIGKPTKDSFEIYFPAMECGGLSDSLPHSEPVPVRLIVDHHLDLLPSDLSTEVFRIIVKTVISDTMSEIAVRCPRQASCICDVSSARKARVLRGCSDPGREFTVIGFIL